MLKIEYRSVPATILNIAQDNMVFNKTAENPLNHAYTDQGKIIDDSSEYPMVNGEAYNPIYHGEKILEIGVGSYIGDHDFKGIPGYEGATIPVNAVHAHSNSNAIVAGIPAIVHDNQTHDNRSFFDGIIELSPRE